MYGYDFARKSIKEEKRIIVTEGYVDTITMSQHGFENATGVMGTAMTQGHLDELVREYGKDIEIVMMYDGDKAGIKAGVKSAKLLVQNKLLGSVVTLPDGQDPAEFLQKYPREAMSDYIENGEPLLQYITRHAYLENAHKNENQRTLAMNSLVKELLSYGTDIIISNQDIADIFKVKIIPLEKTNAKAIENQKMINSIAYSFATRAYSTEQMKEVFPEWASAPNEESKHLFNEICARVDNYINVINKPAKQDNVVSEEGSNTMKQVSTIKNEAVSKEQSNENNVTPQQNQTMKR